MHEGWGYGLALVVFVLLVIAAVLLAYDDNHHDNHHRVEERERSRPVLQLPLDFGVL